MPSGPCCVEILMNWAYIAGFFDGEGNVCMPLGSNTVLLNITQAGDRGRETLEEIITFLESHKIQANYRKRQDIVNRKPVYMLWVRPTYAALFLLGVLPYLRIKRTIAQDILRAKLLFPSLTKSKAGRTFRVELAQRNNAPRIKPLCLRGHEYTVSSGRRWCRECLKLAYRNRTRAQNSILNIN